MILTVPLHRGCTLFRAANATRCVVLRPALRALTPHRHPGLLPPPPLAVALSRGAPLPWLAERNTIGIPSTRHTRETDYATTMAGLVGEMEDLKVKRGTSARRLALVTKGSTNYCCICDCLPSCFAARVWRCALSTAVNTAAGPLLAAQFRPGVYSHLHLCICSTPCFLRIIYA